MHSNFVCVIISVSCVENWIKYRGSNGGKIMEGYHGMSWRKKIEYADIGVFESDSYKEYENEWKKLEKGKEKECERMVKKLQGNKLAASDIVELIFFVCELYDAHYEKEYICLDEKDKGLLIDFSGKRRTIEKEESKRDSLKAIKACSQKDNSHIKKDIGKLISEAINARHIESEMDDVLRKWRASCELYVSFKEVCEWLLFLWTNKDITDDFLKEIFYKAKAGMIKKKIDGLTQDLKCDPEENGDDNFECIKKIEDRIKKYTEIYYKLGEGDVTIEDIKEWLQEEICKIRNANREIELKQEIEVREKLLVQIDGQDSSLMDDIIFEWTKINKGIINAYLISRLQEREKKLNDYEYAYQNDYSLEEDLENPQEKKVFLSEISLSKQAIQVVKDCIANNTIYKQENEQLSGAMRQLGKLYGDKDRSEELKIENLMKMLDEEDIEWINLSFQRWLVGNERETEYLRALVTKVFMSDLIIPDIMSDFFVKNLIAENNCYEYERMGEIENMTGLSHVENKRIGSFSADVNKWIENGIEVVKTEKIDGNEGKIQKHPIAKIMRIHSLWIPFIDIVNSDKVKTKDFLFNGKLEELGEARSKSIRYCSQVDNIIDSSVKCIERLDKPLKEFNEECATKVELSIDVRKTITDMVINRLVGHRYATDIGEFIINIGKREMAGYYDTTYVKKVKSVTMKNLQNEKFRIYSVDSSQEMTKETFVDASVKLPPYWQSVFWNIIYEYINRLQDKFYSIAEDAIKDKNKREFIQKRVYLQDKDFLDIMYDIISKLINELQTIFSDKMGIIFYLLRERGSNETVLSETEINEVIATLMNSAKFSDIAEWIWRNMIDFDYYMEKTRQNEDFRILRDKTNPSKFSQRKTNIVYDTVGRTFIKQHG